MPKTIKILGRYITIPNLFDLDLTYQEILTSNSVEQIKQALESNEITGDFTHEIEGVGYQLKWEIN